MVVARDPKILVEITGQPMNPYFIRQAIEQGYSEKEVIGYVGEGLKMLMPFLKTTDPTYVEAVQDFNDCASYDDAVKELKRVRSRVEKGLRLLDNGISSYLKEAETW